MRKLAIAVCLIGILVGSTLGGMALADKGGDPNYGSSQFVALDEIEQKASTILEGVGNITNRLDNPDWGLGEIKSEIAAIEGNLTDQNFGLQEIKAEIERIESDVNTILNRMTCVLKVNISEIAVWHQLDKWEVKGEVSASGAYLLYDVALEVFIDDVGPLKKITKGNLERGTYSFDFDVNHPVDCNVSEIYEVTVRASGWAPWNQSLITSVTDRFDACEEP